MIQYGEHKSNEIALGNVYGDNKLPNYARHNKFLSIFCSGDS